MSLRKIRKEANRLAVKNAAKITSVSQLDLKG